MIKILFIRLIKKRNGVIKVHEPITAMEFFEKRKKIKKSLR